MNRKTIAAALFAAGFALSAPALAQMGPDGGDPDGDATLTREESAARAAAMFERMDADKDGFVTPEEMAAARPGGAPAGGPPPGGERREGMGGPRGGMGGMMMRQADTNGDGKISKDEFLAAQARRFARMDENGDGKATKEERQAFFEDMRARMMMMGGGGN